MTRPPLLFNYSYSYYGNRTEWSPIGSVLQTELDFTPLHTSDTCLSRVWLLTELLPINHKNYNFREKKSQVIKRREILLQKIHNNKNVIEWRLLSAV